MVCIHEKKCPDCRETYQGDLHNTSEKCNDCETKEKEAKEKAYFDEIDKLTPEERLRKVEMWIYEHKPTYVPPMRFR